MRNIFYTCNDTTVKRLEELGYEVERLSCRHEDYPELPEAPEAADYETTEEYEKNTKKPKGTSSRSRKITRLNARTYYAEVKRGKYRSMFLSVTKTSFSVM